MPSQANRPPSLSSAHSLGRGVGLWFLWTLLGYVCIQAQASDSPLPLPDTIFQTVGQRTSLQKASGAELFVYRDRTDVSSDDIQATKQHYRQALARGDSLQMIALIRILGQGYSVRAEYDKALAQFGQGLQIAKRLSDSSRQALLLLNIARIHHLQRKLHLAFGYYQRALDMARQIPDERIEANATTAIGLIYANLGFPNIALEHYYRALDMHKRTGQRLGEATTYNCMGLAYGVQFCAEEAILLFQNSIWINERLGNTGEAARSLNNLCDTYLWVQGMPAKVLPLADRALRYAQELGYLELIQDAADRLYEANRALGRAKPALDMLELYNDMERQIKTEENQRASLEFEYAQKAAQDSLVYLRRQSQLELSHQRRISQRNYLLLGVLALGILGVILLRSRQQRSMREAQQALEQQEAEARRLAELDQARAQLYNNITHEFRTPLTIILGMAKRVKESPEQWLSEGVSMIERNSQHLLRLINQLLDLARLEARQLSLHPVPLEICACIRYLVASLQLYAESQGLSLTLELEARPLHAMLDGDRLKEVLSNLLSNAIKFTPRGGSIRVIAQVEQQRLHLQVQDTGPGIAAEHLPHVFDRFYQVEGGSTRSQEGTGIGLALSRELTQLMGGSLEVESQLGQGSTFILSIPLTPVQTLPTTPATPAEAILLTQLPKKAAAKPSGQDPTKLRILLVEDHADVSAYIQSCLEPRYRVDLAANGKEGLRMAQTIVPDLIVSDVMMPQMDGYELCYQLKQDLRSSHIPIILLTARADVSSRLTGLRKGADAYLSKPFEEAELHVQIDNLLSSRRQLQAYYTQSEDSESPPPDPVEDAFITRFRSYVMEHIDNPELDVSQLCKAMKFSRTPLHNKLKALTGLSTTDFVRRIRLTRAQELLRTTDLTVAEVAYQTGFKHPTHFSRKFKEAFSITPKAYREESPHYPSS